MDGNLLEVNLDRIFTGNMEADLEVIKSHFLERKSLS